MKNPRLKLFLFLFFFPLIISAQQLSGVWSGRLSNDSLNTRKDQTYELALTEYRGKVYGYSYTTFIYDDTLYYIVKRVKGKIENDICEVEDDEIVSHNFFRKIDKKVKVTQTFRMNKNDSTWHLDGKWKTNQTKEYYSLTGGVALQQEKDFDKSRLLQHLGDLKLDKDISFYQPEKKIYLSAPRKTVVRKEDPVFAKADPGKKKFNANSGVGELEIKNPEPVSPKPEPDIVLVKPDQSIVAKAEPEKKKVEVNSGVGAREIKKQEPVPVKTEPDIVLVKPDQSIIAKAEPEKKKVEVNSGVGAMEIKKQDPVPVKTEPDIVLIKPDQSAVTSNKPVTVIRNADTIQRRSIALTLSNPVFEERKKNVIQTVTYKTDSLILALYDNGEVDGDTVSIFINGEALLEKQGLKSSAIKKTIYMKGEQYEEVEILLFADNLGKYPPNTGLLIIRDGDDRYEIRFSADFEQSAAIILRRKKN